MKKRIISALSFLFMVALVIDFGSLFGNLIVWHSTALAIFHFVTAIPILLFGDKIFAFALKFITDNPPPND